jgi:uncharacterized protein YfdQ (DUF2303 family)
VTDLHTEAAVDALLAAGAVDVDEHHIADDTTPDLLTAVVPAGYKVETVDLSTYDRLRSVPRRVTGDAVVTDTSSWLAYYGKYADDSAEVFGDVRTSTVVGILNAPDAAAAPGWGDHRVTLQLQHSAAWQAWVALNGKPMSQTRFAEHIEDRTPDLVEPDAATMLEVAQSIEATNGLKFESGSRLQSGQKRFVYTEKIEARAGQRGELDIPTQIKIKLPVWRGVDIAVEMTARFRFRITAEGLQLAYVLDQLDDQVDAAWSALLDELTSKIPVPVLAGKAPSYGGRW